MGRSRGGSKFWVMLIMAALVPATLLAVKQVHQSKIMSNGVGVGSSVVNIKNGSYDYIARTFARPGQTIWFAELYSADWGGDVIPLCTNGGPVEDDCSYTADGNLDIDGAITPSMLVAAGVTGGEFNAALNAGTLYIRLSDGSTGVYVRIL